MLLILKYQNGYYRSNNYSYAQTYFRILPLFGTYYKATWQETADTSDYIIGQDMFGNVSVAAKGLSDGDNFYSGNGSIGDGGTTGATNYKSVFYITRSNNGKTISWYGINARSQYNAAKTSFPPTSETYPSSEVEYLAIGY